MPKFAVFLEQTDGPKVSEERLTEIQVFARDAGEAMGNAKKEAIRRNKGTNWQVAKVENR